MYTGAPGEPPGAGATCPTDRLFVLEWSARGHRCQYLETRLPEPLFEWGEMRFQAFLAFCPCQFMKPTPKQYGGDWGGIGIFPSSDPLVFFGVARWRASL